MIRFKTFRYSLGILIISAALCGFWQSANAQIVEIPDPNLELAIREKLGLSSESPITQQEMLKLFRLSAQDAQIENLTGLEYATNLEILILEANRITDLRPLSNLTALETLRLGHNYIVDISPLANLIQLTNLNLVDNQIKDVGALANLTQLTDLALANNAITDFRPLFGLNLQSVDIDIHKLQELVSSEIEIPDPNLERAIREELGLSSEFPITQQEMLRLTSFAAEVLQVQNLTGLEYATNLKNLYLRDNPIKDLTPLANLTQLELLHLAGVPIQDLTPIQNLTQLKHLRLSHCGLTDITPIQKLTKLVLLNLAANQIVDIGPLSNLTALEVLWIDNNQIADVSPLSNLTALRELHISHNSILDFSPLWRLNLTSLLHDEECLVPPVSVVDRIDNRSLPSIVLAWDDGILNRGGDWWDDSIPYDERIAFHDLYFGFMRFGPRFQLTPQGYQVMGDLPEAITRREELFAKNPNILSLVEIRQRDAHLPSHYPADFPYWLRDEDGNLVQNWHESSDLPKHNRYLLDFRQPGMQDIIVEQAIAVAKCGLYDGIFFDWWEEDGISLANFHHPNGPIIYSAAAEEREARLAILQRIRVNVPDDFLILCNRNRRKLPISAPYVNGSFMETFPRVVEHGYTREDIVEIETNLIWLEENLREPQINCLRGLGIGTEPPDSPRNKQWMRLFTTMSLTLSDGYALYTLGTIGGQKQYQKHIWHPFWDADLGQPIGPTTQRYQDIEGLYIREFTNGWAVYNRSGKPQEISLSTLGTPVSDRGSTAASLTHLLSDLDGEIYLKTKHPADVNGDWVVNILDLVQVANGFGQSSPDPNGDGVVNVLDLVFVSRYFSAEE